MLKGKVCQRVWQCTHSVSERFLKRSPSPGLILPFNWALCQRMWQVSSELSGAVRVCVQVQPSRQKKKKHCMCLQTTDMLNVDFSAMIYEGQSKRRIIPSDGYWKLHITHCSVCPIFRNPSSSDNPSMAKLRPTPLCLWLASARYLCWLHWLGLGISEIG